MKLLVLSPGEPSFVNSGLGVAANALNKELALRAQLTTVQPENKSIEQIAFEEREHIIKVEKKTFVEEKIVLEETKIKIAAQLDPYHYGIHSSQSQVELSNQIASVKKELTSYTEQVVTKVEALDFDIIYAHDWITFQAAVKIKEKTGRPLALHVHSLDYDRGAKYEKSFVYDIEEKAFQKADIIIAVSQYTADVLNEHYTVPLNKIKVVHNAINTIKLPKVEKTIPEKLILFVGRLSGQKGPGIFMDIAEGLTKRRNDLRFVMVGDGELLKELIERGANPMSSGKFHFTGHIDYGEVLKLYSIADVYCMPSVSEPFGLSAIEAAGAGLPTVLSKQSGAAEILEGALTSNHWDVESFIDDIEKLLNSDKIANKSVSLNKKSIEGLTWGKAAEEVLKTLKNLIVVDDSSL